MANHISNLLLTTIVLLSSTSGIIVSPSYDYGQPEEETQDRPYYTNVEQTFPTGGALVNPKVIEITRNNHFAVPIVKHVGIPVPQPYAVGVPHPVPVAVPQPYAVNIPVPHPVPVPIFRTRTVTVEKPVAYAVERRIPYVVERPYPVPYETKVPVHVPQPYPVAVSSQVVSSQGPHVKQFLEYKKYVSNYSS